jgi:anti-sigma regulatory factor (Ser/Thr protein kinase)
MSVLPRTTTWSFDSSTALSAHESRIALMQFVRKYATADSDLFSTELILGELLTNVVEHAPGRVYVHIDWTGERPVIRVRDSGPGFDASRDPVATDPYAEDGRGLLLVKSLADNVRIRTAPGFGTEISARLPVSRDTSSANYAVAVAA